jgi:hypothetical protein
MLTHDAKAGLPVDASDATLAATAARLTAPGVKNRDSGAGPRISSAPGELRMSEL